MPCYQINLSLNLPLVLSRLLCLALIPSTFRLQKYGIPREGEGRKEGESRLEKVEGLPALNVLSGVK